MARWINIMDAPCECGQKGLFIKSNGSGKAIGRLCEECYKNYYKEKEQQQQIRKSNHDFISKYLDVKNVRW
jgi:uncharacterized membrane protein YebE (DUF533 family)